MRTILNFKFSILNSFRSRRSSKGFTLIELLMYMGIFSILIVVLFQLLTSIFDLQLESESAGSVSQDGRFIVNRLSYDIARATTVSAPAIGSQDQTLVITEGANTLTYSVSQGNLILTVNPSGTSDQLNSINTSVSNLNFYHLSDNDGKSNTVTVSFTLTSKIQRRAGPNSLDFKTTAGIRSP